MNRHVFERTLFAEPGVNLCASCGREWSDPIHITPHPYDEIHSSNRCGRCLLEREHPIHAVTVSQKEPVPGATLAGPQVDDGVCESCVSDQEIPGGLRCTVGPSCVATSNPTKETLEEVRTNAGKIHQNNIELKKRVEKLEQDRAGDQQRLSHYEAKIEELKKENDKMRVILAESDLPCVYCGEEDIVKCKFGFPGCARADDMSLNPNFPEPVTKINRTYILRRYVQSVAQNEGIHFALRNVLWDTGHFKENPFSKEEEEWLMNKVFPSVWAEFSGKPEKEFKEWWDK